MRLQLESVPGAPWPVLSPGIHIASLSDFALCFAINPSRRKQFVGLLEAVAKLRHAGCAKVYIDGSYVTGKPEPGDYDACWDPAGVDRSRLDPIFLDFENGRRNQKFVFMGEFFPASATAERVTGRTFIEFFQIEKHTGANKGIVAIDLLHEDIDSLLEEWK